MKMKEVMIKPWIKILFITCTTIFMMFTNLSMLVAKEGEAKVLVIYTTKDGEINENQRYLDLLIGHFTSDIRFISSDEVKKSDLLSVTHLFYFGQVATGLPAKFETLFDDFEGTFVALGYNSEKLGDRFTFVNPQHEVSVDQLSAASGSDFLDITKMYMIEIEPDEGAEILINGRMKQERVDYPVLVKEDQNFFIPLIHWIHANRFCSLKCFTKYSRLIMSMVILATLG